MPRNNKTVLTFLIFMFGFYWVHSASDIDTLKYYEKLFFIYDGTSHGAPIDDGEEAYHDYRKATITRESDGAVVVHLKAFALTITVTLQKDVSEGNAIVEIHDGENTTLTTTEEMGIVSYVGTARAEPVSDDFPIQGTAIGFVLDGIFEGSFQLANETYYIESARSYCEQHCKHNAIIYKSSDVLAASLLKGKCSISHIIQPEVLSEVDSGIFQEAHMPDEFDNGLIQYMKDPNRPRFCNIEVVADHTYYAFRKNTHNVLSKLKQYVRHVNDMYQRTDFNQDGMRDNIGIKIGKFTVFQRADDKGNPFKSSRRSADALLNDFAKYKNSFCLAFGFLHREFGGRDLGMAFIASMGRKIGGICQKGAVAKHTGKIKTAYGNVGIVTSCKNEHVLPDAMIILTIAHETGHSFGSHHDPIGDDEKCSPRENKYIMYKDVQYGSKRNNYWFSSCSLNEMLPIIKFKGKCFIEGSMIENHFGDLDLTTGKCGNRKVEPGEECDCGPKENCEKIDHCCTPPGGEKANKECHVRRSAGYQCSPSQGPCCEKNCTFSPKGTPCDQFPIGSDGSCTKDAKCTGKSVECPPGATPLANGTPCLLTFKTCVKGKCRSNVCEDNKFKTCECPEEGNDRCEVCCLKRDRCAPASRLDLLVQGKKALQLRGTLCADFLGYRCNSEGQCRLEEYVPVGYTGFSLYTIMAWMNHNWLYFLLAIIVILVVVGTVQSRKFFMQHRSSMKMLMYRVQIAKKKVEKEYPEFREVTKKPPTYFALCRLVVLFPKAPVENLRVALAKFTTEREVVKYLLSKGYQMKKL